MVAPPGFSVHGDSQGKNTGVGCLALFQGNLPNPEIEPRSPTLQANSLLSEPPGKPRYKYVTSVFLQLSSQLYNVQAVQESTQPLKPSNIPQSDVSNTYP